MARVIIGVKGMRNEAAVAKIKEILSAIQGVQKVDADKNEQATVTYDERVVTVMDLVGRLRRLGIRAGME